MKKILSLFLCPILIFSSVACNKASDSIAIDEKKLPIEESKEDIKNVVDYIPAEDFIEMRGSNLWLNIKDIDKLSLDGEPYQLSEELIELLDSSHVKISYPLMILNADSVYNMETKEVMFTIEDIIHSLEKAWGNTMGINGVNPYGDEMELEPEYFNFIDNVSMSPTKRKIAFSIHLYFLASFASITGVFHVDNTNIEFVDGPFMGQVDGIRWSPDENYFAYTSGTTDDKYKVHVVNAKDFKELVSIPSTQLLEDPTKERVYIIPTIGEWLDEGHLSVELKCVGVEGNVEKCVTRSIKYIE